VENLKSGTRVRVFNVCMGGEFDSGNKGGNVCESKQDLLNSRKY